MPPKVKISREEIVSAALGLVRERGEEALNARAVAVALSCSTQPVFSNFGSMEELRAAVLEAAYAVYTDFLRRETEMGKYPQYKSFGMAYIRFAAEEKELFRFLFMRDRRGEANSPTLDFDASVEYIMEKNGVSRELATMIHLEVWIFVHGIAVMVATSFLSLEWEMISDMLSDAYQGIRMWHLEGKNERD